MPAIGKQRRANRNKTFRKRRDRFAGSSKPKPFTPLSGKLKSNNNLLAKALSAQKQETQLLFSEKVELSSQLQTLKMACNKRDLMFANVQKNAKEMLSMLVTMTNYVTNTIMTCQEFSHKSDCNTTRPRSASVTRRDSTRRLSTKSPARGVVKPMVSGHTITKPTINLRRVNMQRLNDMLDLSIIDEGPSSPMNNSTINTSRTHTASHTAAFTTANRLGYEGERRRRLPERIPVAYGESDDDEGEALGRQETRLSARFSGRMSKSLTRKLSENTLMCQIRSPSVSLCDVSKLLQNSQTINVRMLQDSQGNGDFNRLSNSVQNFSQRISNGGTPRINIAVRKSEGARKSLEKTLQSSSACREVPIEKSLETVNQTDKNSAIDPMEGPSWLLDGSAVKNRSFDDEEQTVDIFRRKHILRKLVSSDSEAEAKEDSDNESMEFTECVKSVQRPLEIVTPRSVDKQTDVISNLPNRIIQNGTTGNNFSKSRDVDNSSSHSDEDEQCANVAVTRPNNFITDRRERYVHHSDDDDDDTIMLQLSKGAKPSKFNINDFRLPVVSCPIVDPVESNFSDPEVTTTIQTIPQNYVPSNLVDDNIEDTVSNIGGLQLPKLDDDLINTKKKKRPVKRKQPRKQVAVDDSDSSNSDSVWEQPKKKTISTAKPNIVKDPSSAKVVLQKLNNTHMKIRATSPDQNLVDKIQDLNATNHRTSETGNSDLVTDSNSSTHSVNESNRPRRQKAPTNLKEPSLSKKLRR